MNRCRPAPDLEERVKSRTLELRRTVMALERKAIEQPEAETLIQKLAHFDTLTGLPNRLLLNKRSALALNMGRRNPQHLALMFLDLEHFKKINDSLGQQIGDELLVALARHRWLAQDRIAERQQRHDPNGFSHHRPEVLAQMA